MRLLVVGERDMSVIEAPSDWVESVGALRFPPRTDQRMQALMHRNNEGQLTDDERLELESLVELSEQLAIVRAEAILLLGKSPS
jgi:hypothetical protein